MVNEKAIIDRVAAKTGLTKRDTKKMLKAFKEVIYEVAREGETLWLFNTLKIKPKTVKARERFSGILGKTIHIEEHEVAEAVLSKNIIEISKKIK